MLYNIRYWWFLRQIGEQNILLIPKYCSQHLACWCLSLRSLWTAFTCCCSLSWLPIWLQNEVMGPCFTHCHIFTQKLLFVGLKQLQRRLWIVDGLLFLIDCEQTLHPLWTQPSHWQMFMQMVNTLHYNIFNSSAILCNFNLRSAKTSL